MKKVFTIAAIALLTQLTGCTGVMQYRAEQIHRAECYQAEAHRGSVTMQTTADDAVQILDDDFLEQCRAEGIIE